MTYKRFDLRGSRHLNDRSRNEWEKRKERQHNEAAWVVQQREVFERLPPDHPARQTFERIHGPIDASEI